MQSAKTISAKLLEKFGMKDIAIKAAKEMQRGFKAGFKAAETDHSHDDLDEWLILKDVVKEIKKL